MLLRLLYEADERQPDLDDEVSLTEPPSELDKPKPKFKSFVDRDTTSGGKLKATGWAKDQGTTLGYGLCVYLVGAPTGLDRHVREKMEMGFTDLSKHVIVERDPATAEALAIEAGQLYPEIKVMKADFKEACAELGWNRIEYIDFDGIEHYNQYADDLIRRAVSAGVDAIDVTVSARGTSKFLLDKARTPAVFQRLKSMKDVDVSSPEVPYIGFLVRAALGDIQGYYFGSRGYTGHSSNAPKKSMGSLKGGHPMHEIALRKSRR